MICCLLFWKTNVAVWQNHSLISDEKLEFPFAKLFAMKFKFLFEIIIITDIDLLMKSDIKVSKTQFSLIISNIID